MPALKVLFCSSSDIGIPLLETLHADERFELIGLVCQPDKRTGRKQELRSPITKSAAIRLGVKVFQPENINSDFIDDFSGTPDFLLTFAYGQILSEETLNLPSKYALNVHASIIPKYRGASPIQAALLNGDTETGISLIQMIKKMDAGPVAAIHRFKISEHMTAGLLFEELAQASAEFIPDQLVGLSDTDFIEQNHSEASYCAKVKKDDGFIDFQESAEKIFRMFHAYTPWPGLWTKFNGKRLKLIDVNISDHKLKSGEIYVHERQVFIGCSKGSLELKQVQMEGKNCLHADVFILGQSDFEGTLPS